MKGIWKNLCTKLIDNFQGFDNLHEGLQTQTDTIINIAKELNFEISPEDVKEVLYADSDEITNGELLEMEKFEREEENEESPERCFSAKMLNEREIYHKTKKKSFQQTTSDNFLIKKTNADQTAKQEETQQKELTCAQEAPVTEDTIDRN
ncbi:Hypothetical predicted protein [Octopus vulgaris]|uniref:Uncharacterized protein n=1 Tax=Octopus vulgaris TaxID=6645 RepID=A0AA36FC62_OCTVU|nr:Hypothetical predicted protein [Octopus vulgaris]